MIFAGHYHRLYRLTWGLETLRKSRARPIVSGAVVALIAAQAGV